MKMNLILLSTCLVCTSCMAAGTQVREDQLSQFHKGQTAERTVTANLGDPNSNSLLPDGSRLICYSYIQAAARPESFIPVVGAFVGGADMHSNNTCFQFAENGVLKDYMSSSTQAGAGSMFASGVHSEGRFLMSRIRSSKRVPARFQSCPCEYLAERSGGQP